MSGEMDWDRIRRENRALLHGSEHIDSDSQVVTSTGKLVPPAKSNKKFEVKRRIKGVSRNLHTMPGCSCGKPVGFTGLHKAKCPLCSEQGKIAPPRMNTRSLEIKKKALPGRAGGQNHFAILSVSEFVIRLNRVHLDADLKNLLIMWQRRLTKDQISSPFDKDLASEAIRAINAELDKYK
jgi:hypothetical protein